KTTREYLQKYSDVAYYNTACKRKEFIYYLIYVDGKNVGYLELEPKRYFKQFYINYVFVEEEYRRNGYSKLLFEYAVEDIRKNFPNIWTISAVPAFIEGKYFLESVGFLPDIFWHSAVTPGCFCIYYLYDEHIFLLDQPEYELLCGNDYNYKLCGVKRYVQLVRQAKAKDPNFSAKNYAYFVAHRKEPRKYTRKHKPTKYDSLILPTFDTPSFDVFSGDVSTFDTPPAFDAGPSFDDIGGPSLDISTSSPTPEQTKPAEVPSLFTDEYIANYMKYLD
ncbi:MAG: GNAT family N-acetyltransferase, partial [Clostridia bacterium]|nr:GNAT family N-acetyltransferase [Clostridia bacterium]